MTMRRLACIALALAAVLPSAGRADAPAPTICLRAPVALPVAFNGAVSYDKAGSGGAAMMYPASGLGGLLVAIATHAAISGGIRESEKARLREEADKILEPYRPALGEFKLGDLLERAVPVMAEGGVKRIATPEAPVASGETAVDSAPAYLLTQDHRAISGCNVSLAGTAWPWPALATRASGGRAATTGRLPPARSSRTAPSCARRSTSAS